MGEIRDFRDLICWQKSIELAKEVYQITASFPSDERFGLTSQIRRAAVSVSSNIAEGHARQGREFANFLSIAMGSLAEIESQLLLAVALGFLEEGSLDGARILTSEIRRMLASLRSEIISIKSPSNPDPRPLTPDP